MVNFDEGSKDWDKDQKKVKRATDVAEGILKHLPETKGMSAMEYGCGTGLLGFTLLSNFKEIGFYDVSKGMLEKVEEKIKKSEDKNCRVIEAIPETGGKEVKYDCIFNLMVLHHLSDVEEEVKKWSDSLEVGGYLCISDLISEDGSFHSSDFHGHLGFDPKDLAKIFEKNGIRLESISHPHTMVKEEKEYPLFLIVGKKI